jgi:subtilisin-like proprotein convertase family protein
MSIAKDNLNCESKLINSLEHVQLKVDLDYTNRAVLVIDIESMSGTSSRFLYPRKFDSIGNPRTYNNLVVTSVHFWGEPLLGRWTVDIKEGTGIHAIQGTGKYV